MITSETKSRSQLGTGLTRSVDSDTQLLFVPSGAQVEQHILQRKAHRACKACQKQPQQNPTAARRHWQPEHHTETRKQKHQESVSACEAIEGSTTDVAGEALVLPC